MRAKAKFAGGLGITVVCVLLVAVAEGGQAAVSCGQSPSPLPVLIGLDEAIRRAQCNDPGYATATGDGRIAALDRSVAMAELLPNVDYHNQFLYTQPNGLLNQAGQGAASQPAPRFIANNAVREYASQVVVNETVGLAGVAVVRRANAASAQAAASLEVARRGLVSAVIGLFYGLAAADNKLVIADRAHTEAVDFTRLTVRREVAREAAHADVVKAQLQEQQRTRDLSNARVAAEKARLELAVLLFPDPHTEYALELPTQTANLPPRAEVERAAAQNNPELRSSLAMLDVNNAEVMAARAAYLPDLGVNVAYGIDAPQFAVNGPNRVQNLGYSASVTIDIPVWDWLSTQHKVKQSEIRRDVAKLALSATQKHLIARLDEAYSEASASRDQLATLDASVATAAESLRLIKLAYQGGEATVLEIVDAEGALLAAQNAREDGLVRYQTALADLQTLTGTM